MHQNAQVLGLWLHECSRVFEDRLTNKDDHDWFRSQQVRALCGLWVCVWGVCTCVRVQVCDVCSVWCDLWLCACVAVLLPCTG